MQGEDMTQFPADFALATAHLSPESRAVAWASAHDAHGSPVRKAVRIYHAIAASFTAPERSGPLLRNGRNRNG